MLGVDRCGFDVEGLQALYPSYFIFKSDSRIVLHLPNFQLSQEFLLDEEIEEDDDCSYNGDVTCTALEVEAESLGRGKRSEEILRFKLNNGLACRQFPVKETNMIIRSEDENGNKMINEYVRECKIGSGSYGKVVLYRNNVDGKHYAIKAFHKSHLLKLRVGPSETAMTDVLREVQIMKILEHPNIVNLIEVIDDPAMDQFYMVLEYVESKWVCEDSGPQGGIGEDTARKYVRDIVSGLMYLHDHNIVHGDIKPDNLLITGTGTVKIGDFSVSQVFEDDNDELRRSPGTPVFTAPECCLGLTYHGKAADTWALGVTLYCMVLGRYPFLGETLQDTYDKIVNNPLILPNDMNPELRNLLEGLLCKAEHTWLMGDDTPIPHYLCWCKRNSYYTAETVLSGSDSDSASFALKDTRKTQVMEGGGEAPPGDSGIKFCTYCGRGFQSNKALYGHLRVHSVTPARPKTGILRINSPKRETKGSDEEDEGFGCFVCSRSFTTMQLLCRHMGIHRGTVSNGVQQQPATSEESNNVSLSEAETTLKLGFESTVFPGYGHKVDFPKNVPSWSQHGKRGWKRSATDSHPAALRFYHGPAEPEHPLMQRKKTSMEGAADSENTVELSRNCLKKLETQKNSRSGHGRRSMKNAAAKNLHQCEICGKTFATGQALGGHKTFHRKLKLVQTKTEQGRQCGEVKEYVTRMLLPEEAPPKKMLDFDLNVPYQE
ncbi:hypothetical protein V6N12_052579 [Hibiscus sabdariffa]|uniref:Uncharacterized protein n=1 Tax=Hibiscus sabdariffa TaxID=183260 RepID=A0ABR2C1Z1_9ROSI